MAFFPKRQQCDLSTVIASGLCHQNFVPFMFVCTSYLFLSCLAHVLREIANGSFAKYSRDKNSESGRAASSQIDFLLLRWTSVGLRTDLWHYLFLCLIEGPHQTHQQVSAAEIFSQSNRTSRSQTPTKVNAGIPTTTTSPLGDKKHYKYESTLHFTPCRNLQAVVRTLSRIAHT